MHSLRLSRALADFLDIRPSTIHHVIIPMDLPVFGTHDSAATGLHLAAESIGQEGPMEAGRDRVDRGSRRSRAYLRDSQDEGTWIKGHGHDGHVPKFEFVGYCWTK